jgi:hypothetical protein
MIEFKFDKPVSRKFDIVCEAIENAKKHEVTRVHVKPKDVHTWRTYIGVRLEIERDILVRTVYFKETQTLYIIAQPKPKGGLLS